MALFRNEFPREDNQRRNVFVFMEKGIRGGNKNTKLIFSFQYTHLHDGCIRQILQLIYLYNHKNVSKCFTSQLF